MIAQRTLVVGDIHGGLKALRQVLDKVEPQKDDLLIFLGDYVDGWSEAVETVDFLLGLSKVHNCILLRGNHDQLCHDWLTTWKDNPMWFQHGGEVTMDGYLGVEESHRKEHIKFFADLKDYYLDAQNRLFLHAGFTNIKGVNYEYFSKMFYWDRTLWEQALSLDPGLKESDPRFPKRLAHYKEIYIGHTPVTRIGKTVPVRAVNVWNVDTGAAFKGPLSVIDIDSKEVWQSDPVHTLYPGEKGRN
ncbi:MAG: metallophosphoesterase family protein [Flavobacteriaceae bacterium]